MNLALVLIGILLTAVSGLLALPCRKNSALATRIPVGAMLLGAMSGAVGGGRAALGMSSPMGSLPWAVPGGELAFRLDALAGIFLVQIFLIGALGSVYAIGYWPESKHSDSSRRVRVFFGLMVAAMALLVIANNSIFFLMAWEVMAVSAFLALTGEHKKPEVRESGFVYLVATRLGTLALIAMFCCLHLASGSFSLSVRNVASNSGLGNAIFWLGLLGFGLKAGIMPLHLWLPGAHASAPTHVSALMSGVLIKMGIYGLLRLGAFFGAIPLGWGLTVFWLGVLSAVMGVAFAIAQHDLKRLLAYHSVENIGIIVMGLGLALIGRSLGHPELVVLGLAGAVLHTFNHGLFKSLLFFGAGSVLNAAGTRNIDVLGGLSRRMPYTAVAFLVGAAAISGLPPLNGFISELFVYLGMLKAGALKQGSVGVLLLFGVPALALVGALAVACFVKVYGVVFLGEPRSGGASDSSESPRSMVGVMAVPAALCILIGILPVFAANTLDRAIAGMIPPGKPPLLAELVPFSSLMLANAGLVVAILLTGVLLRLRVSKERAPVVPTWDCGYLGYAPRMQYTASSFADTLVTLFSAVLRPRVHRPNIEGAFPARSQFASHVPEVVLELAVYPVARAFGTMVTWFRWIQTGSINHYVFYILAALVVMLFIWR